MRRSARLFYTSTVQVRLVLGLMTSGFCLLGCASFRPAVSDLDNRPVNPLADRSAAAVVLVFISNDCPVSNRYAPELNRLYEQFRGQGVVFWLVHADPNETAKDIRAHALEYGLNVPELRDPGHELVKMSRADVTPSAAVFASGPRLIYHGRIDDRFVELGKERPEALHHDLIEVLHALLQHHAIPVASTRAIGCYIPGR